MTGPRSALAVLLVAVVGLAVLSVANIRRRHSATRTAVQSTATQTQADSLGSAARPTSPPASIPVHYDGVAASVDVELLIVGEPSVGGVITIHIQSADVQDLKRHIAGIEHCRCG